MGNPNGGYRDETEPGKNAYPGAAKISDQGTSFRKAIEDQEETINHWQRLWWLARDLLRTGVLQRWAYVSCFTVCIPGQEEAVFERVKRLIAASVPEFQLPPKSAEVAAMAKP